MRVLFAKARKRSRNYPSFTPQKFHARIVAILRGGSAFQIFS
jgi:hypothetical protein